MSDAVKYRAIVRLHEGVEPKLIAEEFDIPYSRVLKYRGELKEAEASGNLNKLLHMDEAAVELMANELVRDLPVELQEQAKAITDGVVSGVKGLDALSGEFQRTAMHINNRIRTLSMGIDHVSELVDLTKALCELQNAFFNKQGVQLNIQNNNGGDASYGEFLSDKPGA
tara:strand:- start:1204 stop:1710 length:507 start_codon:yes stop_codon:yes gene_type:complete